MLGTIPKLRNVVGGGGVGGSSQILRIHYVKGGGGGGSRRSITLREGGWGGGVPAGGGNFRGFGEILNQETHSKCTLERVLSVKIPPTYPKIFRLRRATTLLI